MSPPSSSTDDSKAAERKDPPAAGVYTAMLAFPSRNRRDINGVDYDNYDDDVVSMITQPLLLVGDHDDYGDYYNDVDVDVEDARSSNSTAAKVVPPSSSSSKRLSSSSPEDGTTTTTTTTPSCRGRFVAMGAVTGFLIQVVSLGAYALMLVRYESMYGDGDIGGVGGSFGGGGSGSSSFSGTISGDADSATVPSLVHDGKATGTAPFNWGIDWFVYGVLSVLTQIDLIIYVLIWVAFTCTMTRNGMRFLRFQLGGSVGGGGGNDGNDDGTSTTTTGVLLKRRVVFVVGVYFLVGIVLGAFAAWSVIDVYLGFPIPFLPIVATVAVDLILCYMMVCCYDLGRDGGRLGGSSSSTTSSGSGIITTSSTNSIVSDSDDDEGEDDVDDDGCACC